MVQENKEQPLQTPVKTQQEEVSDDLIDSILAKKLSDFSDNFPTQDYFPNSVFNFNRLDAEIPSEVKESKAEDLETSTRRGEGKYQPIQKKNSKEQSESQKKHEYLSHEERLAWINRLRRSTVNNPNNKQSFLDLGVELINVCEYDAAVTALRRAIQIDSKYGNAHLNLGICYYTMNFKDRAIQSYLDCVEVDPKNDHAFANLGSVYLENQDLETALFYYQKAIEQNSKNFIALRNRSLIYLYENKNDLAYQSASALVELPGASDEDWMVFGIILANLEQHEEAVYAYEKAIKLQPKNAILYSNQANSYKEIHELKFAEEQYIKAIELNPDESNFRFNLAEFYLEQNKINLANTQFQKAVELDATDKEAWAGIAKTLIDVNPYEAMRACVKAVELGYKDGEVLNFLAELQEKNGLIDQSIKTRQSLYKRIPTFDKNTRIHGIQVLKKGNPFKAWEILNHLEIPQKEDLEEWWAISENLRYKNKFTEEFDCLIKILKADVIFYRAWDRLGVIALSKNLSLKAYEYFSRSNGLSNLRYEINLNLNEMLLGISEEEKAAQVALNMNQISRYSPKIWSKILRNHRRNNYLGSLVDKLIDNLFQEDGSYHELLEFAKVLDSMKFYHHSEKIYHRLLERYPENEEILNQRSLNLNDQKRISEAKALIKSHLKEGTYEIYNTYGEALYLEGKDDEAHEQFMESLKYRQDDYRVWFNLGNIEVRRQNFEKGIEYYQKSISIWAGESKTWYNLGYTKEKMKNLEEALEYYQTSTKKNRKNAFSWNAIGVLKYGKRELQSAKYSFLCCLAQEKEYKNAWNNLSIIFDELNQPQKSLSCLKEYEKLNENKKRTGI